MSSSPSTSSIQSTSMYPVQPRNGERYRQTVYHDGAGRHIAECCRRSGLVQKVKAPTTTHQDWILYPASDATEHRQGSPSHASLPHNRSPSSSYHGGLAPHVTKVKRSSKARPKAVVIVTSSKPAEAKQSSIKMSFHQGAELTPPPTPRMERLPSLDLSDLDAPFCNCGIHAHIVKFCAFCNTKVDFQPL
ncbi:hypothetical protein IQ07DRAFT_42138 [Pyrenochaeta sp. DS3sAY3a]|nr:hypothetical protein IQ07DRAFT_42138 [Pyrenochaeta sp. DS3sAY3a]